MLQRYDKEIYQTRLFTNIFQNSLKKINYLQNTFLKEFLSNLGFLFFKKQVGVHSLQRKISLHPFDLFKSLFENAFEHTFSKTFQNFNMSNFERWTFV